MEKTKKIVGYFGFLMVAIVCFFAGVYSSRLGFEMGFSSDVRVSAIKCSSKIAPADGTYTDCRGDEPRYKIGSADELVRLINSLEYQEYTIGGYVGPVLEITVKRHKEE